MVLVAPNNAAFDSYLTAAGLTPAEALANTDLLLNTLGAHIAYANNANDMNATTVSNSTLNFENAVGKAAPIEAVKPKYMVLGPNNNVTVTKVIPCADTNTYVFAVDGVLEPEETAAPAQDETAAPAQDETAAPAQDETAAPSPEAEMAGAPGPGQAEDSSSMVFSGFAVTAAVLAAAFAA